MSNSKHTLKIINTVVFYKSIIKSTLHLLFSCYYVSPLSVTKSKPNYSELYLKALMQNQNTFILKRPIKLLRATCLETVARK